MGWNNANITAHCGEAIELGYTPECCCQEHSSYGGVVAVVFFIFFTVLGALVLMTLFIGVITTSMEEAQEEQEEKKAEEDEIKQIMEEACLATEMVKTYRMCFDLLDVDGGGSIDTDELRQGLALIK